MAPPSTTALELRTKVWLERDRRFVVGDGGLRLLEAVAARGSLLAAARALGWSYRHAWAYLKRAEAVLGTALVASRPGKGRRRGTVLAADGERLVATLAGARRRLDALFGTTGPTPIEVAARGRGRAAGSSRARRRG